MDNPNPNLNAKRNTDPNHNRWFSFGFISTLLKILNSLDPFEP